MMYLLRLSASSWNRFRNSSIVKLNIKVVSETKITMFYHLQFENLFHIYNLICDSNILNVGSKLLQILSSQAQRL